MIGAISNTANKQNAHSLSNNFIQDWQVEIQERRKNV